MKKEYEISRLEKIAINAYTPLSFILIGGKIKYSEIVQEKLYFYSKLLDHFDSDGNLPHYVSLLYKETPFGMIALKTAQARHYFDRHKV